MSRKGPAAVDPVAWTPDSGERLRGRSPRWAAHRSTRRSSGVKPSNWSALRSGRSWRSPGRVEPPIRRCTPGSQADREARARAEDPDGLTESQHDELQRLRKELIDLPATLRRHLDAADV